MIDLCRDDASSFNNVPFVLAGILLYCEKVQRSLFRGNILPISNDRNSRCWKALSMAEVPELSMRFPHVTLIASWHTCNMTILVSAFFVLKNFAAQSNLELFGVRDDN